MRPGEHEAALRRAAEADRQPPHEPEAPERGERGDRLPRPVRGVERQRRERVADEREERAVRAGQVMPVREGVRRRPGARERQGGVRVLAVERPLAPVVQVVEDVGQRERRPERVDDVHEHERRDDPLDPHARRERPRATSQQIASTPSATVSSVRSVTVSDVSPGRRWPSGPTSHGAKSCRAGGERNERRCAAARTTHSDTATRAREGEHAAPAGRGRRHRRAHERVPDPAWEDGDPGRWRRGLGGHSGTTRRMPAGHHGPPEPCVGIRCSLAAVIRSGAPRAVTPVPGPRGEHRHTGRARPGAP